MAENPELKCKDVRLSFADNLYIAEEGEKRTKGKHKGKIPFRNSANFLIPKTNTTLIEAIKEKMMEARDQQWPKDPPKIKNDKLCLQDGDEVDYAGYAGHMYLSASRTTYGTPDDSGRVKMPPRPYKILPAKKSMVDGELRFVEVQEGQDGAPYSGCYVNVIVRFWAQDDEDYGKRINASIEGVQYNRRGDAFGGGKKLDVNKAFDDADGDDEDAHDEDEAPAPKASTGGGLLD
jgi:hypothetical protein